VEAIDRKEFPRWNVKLQVMTDAQAKKFPWNPFDLTKVWPHADYPLIDVGVMELNEVPENYFAEVEQAAFAPAHVVDGIGYSPDKMLQGRLLSYPDAHRYRLGVNYEQIPVNKCPFHVANYQRDGHMRVDGNGGGDPNYYPNSFDDIVEDPSTKEPPMKLDSMVADWFDRNENDDDHFTQPGLLFRKAMTPQEHHREHRGRDERHLGAEAQRDRQAPARPLDESGQVAGSRDRRRPGGERRGEENGADGEVCRKRSGEAQGEAGTEGEEEGAEIADDSGTHSR
jgi:catalase